VHGVEVEESRWPGASISLAGARCARRERIQQPPRSAMRRYRQLRERGDARLAHRFADRGTGEAAFDEWCSRDRRGRFACGAQVAGLWIRGLAAAETAPLVRFADDEEALEAFGTAQRIGLLQETEHGRGPQFESAVRIEVQAANQFRERGVFDR